ncbi:MAG: hypothetical protein AB7U82_01110 [Blastocatellales bacterium]
MEKEKQLSVMQWVSFVLITVLFGIAATSAIIREHETDKIIAGLFLIVTGFAWGANLTKFVIRK